MFEHLSPVGGDVLEGRRTFREWILVGGSRSLGAGLEVL